MGWNFATKPGNWITVTSTERNFLFTQGSSKSFTLSRAGISGETYEVRNGITGSVVASGSINGTTTITVPTTTSGYFLLWLYGASVATWGTSIGEVHFSVFPSDGRFVANPASSSGVTGRSAGAVLEAVTRGVFAMGPFRHYIFSAASPTTADGSGDGNIAAVLANVAKEKTWYSASGSLDSARPRPLLCQFPNGTTGSGQPAGVTTAVAALYPDVTWFEGPSNEPQWQSAATVAAQIETFADAVHAGNASAKVLVPNPVDINGNSTPWLDTILGLLGPTGRAKVDGYSVHVYNSVLADVGLGRRCLAGFEAVLTKYGEQGKPRWQTEQGGDFPVCWGVFQPRWGIQHTSILLLMLEQFGIPKEHNHFWYDDSHGFWDYPSFWSMNGYILPQATMHRTWSAELFGKTHTARLDFGAEHQEVFLGSSFTNATTGDKVLAIVTCGMPSASVTLAVTGASSLTVADTWGNTSSAAVTGGRTSVAVGDSLAYVRVPSGVTATVVAPGYGPDFASRYAGGRIAGAGSIKARRIIDDGHRRSGYYQNDDTTGADEFPYFDDTIPATVGPVTFQAATRVDRARVFFAPPRHRQCAPLEFHLDTLGLDGTTWTTRATFGPITPTTLSRVSSSDTTACKLVCWYDNQWVVDLTWSPVVALAVRIVVSGTTLGAAANAAVDAVFSESGSGLGNGFPQRATVRKIQVFSEQSQQPKVLVTT